MARKPSQERNKAAKVMFVKEVTLSPDELAKKLGICKECTCLLGHQVFALPDEAGKIVAIDCKKVGRWDDSFLVTPPSNVENSLLCPRRYNHGCGPSFDEICIKANITVSSKGTSP